MGIDRLSELPDCLLISILSLLSTQEAIRTCVLSRRWLLLWNDLPELAFREKSYEDAKVSKFVAEVHQYIAHCSGNHVQRFEVSFRYKKDFASDVNTWVQFALKHKVKDVALLLEIGKYSGDEYDYLLPQMMYCNSYMTRLRLEGSIIMAPKNTIQWGALSSLHLEWVEFYGDATKNILSGCPVLHDLTLNNCWHYPGLNRLHVESQSLRELTIIGCFGNDADNEILMQISAPLIHYARISVDVKRRKFELTNISSLVEADIDFENYQTDGMSTLIGYTTGLFEKLRHAKKLKVGPKFIQALGDMFVEAGLQLSQSRVECLQLNAKIHNKDTTSGIVFLLESSPNINKLFISLSRDISQDGLEKFELSREFFHLKTITITVLEKPELVAETMLTLVRLLLKRAPILEKLVIDFSVSSWKYYKVYCPPEFTKIALKLLSYPRASTKAAVELVPIPFYS